jgi:CubicO group peptidase (beta-lactamase class C family)
MDVAASYFPLQSATPDDVGLDPRRLGLLCATIERQIAGGDYPGAQVAVARHGKLALFRSFGVVRTASSTATTDETLFLLYSNTKVITAATIWTLVEDGVLRYGDRVADVLPGFGKHRKGEITLLQLLTHQAGFPGAIVPPDIIEDHAKVRAAVCDFVPEWSAGARVHYHPAAAHWVAAMMIEEVTGQDFRAVIRDRITGPLGIAGDVLVGVDDAAQARCADMHDPAQGMAAIAGDCSASARRAGRPGGGGHGTARGMAAFYQALVQGGQLGGTRILSPRTLEYIGRNFTGTRVDLNSGASAQRGMGPYVRGDIELARSIGTLAHPSTFGHGGAGSSYCWGDPESGVSFAFLSNARHGNDVHDARMDALSNIVHASIIG